MLDPITIAAIKASMDVAIGAIPQISTAVHDANTRRRLGQLNMLFIKAKSEVLNSEEINEAIRLYSKIQVQALLIENPTLLEHLEKGMVCLEAHKAVVAENRPEFESLKEEIFVSEESTPLFLPAPPYSGPSLSNEKSKELIVSPSTAQQPISPTSSCPTTSLSTGSTGSASEALIPASSSSSLSNVSLKQQDDCEPEDPIIAQIANSTKQKTHPMLKKSACWLLVVTVGPVVLFAPQVRRNMFTSRK